MAVAVYFSADRLGDEKPRQAPRYTTASRTGSRLVTAKPAKPIAISGIPMTYDVTSDVDNYGGGRVVRTVERLRVRRPFDSRLETRAAEGDDPPSVQVSTFARIDILARGEAEATSVVVPPFISGSDVRVDAVLPELLRDKRLVARELRQVGRHRCQVFRGDKSLRAGELAPIGASPTSFVDSCVDARGLVLEEVTVSSGRITARRVATRVAADVRLADSVFPHDTLAPPESTIARGRGSVRPVDPASRSIGEFWELDTAPRGFARHGRFAVVPPSAAPEKDTDPEEARRQRVASVSDVWVRGADVVIVDQGGSLGRTQRLVIPDGAPRVDLGPLGSGGVMLDTRMSEVRVLQPRGRFVRVYGTRPTEELVAIARALRQTEGTGLTYLS